MEEKIEYYISVKNKMVETTKIPGQAELKIHATEEEIKQIKEYMDNKNKVNLEVDEAKRQSKGNASASYTPAVGDDENYDSDFEKLIELIYKLGTEKTKQSLEQYR